jgi:4'-phosphopantetheinyl transferase EntD
LPDAATQTRARYSSAVAALFPAGFLAAELVGTGDPAELTAEELECARSFSAKRRAEFAAGRACARLLLAQHGHGSFSLLPGEDRRPQWPSGIVGSISHTEGFCGAVTARTVDAVSVGFDAEVVGGVEESLWPQLFTGSEREALRALPAEMRAFAATVTFGAKEAFYKCRFGVDPRWIDFTDVVVRLRIDTTFAGSFEVCGPAYAEEASPASGRFALYRNLALTGIFFQGSKPQPEY